MVLLSPHLNNYYLHSYWQKYQNHFINSWQSKLQSEDLGDGIS